MKIIDVTLQNLETEHICCAIADKKGECCVGSKQAWMREGFSQGLVFKKLDVRGKVFIEYMPAEQAWCPITAENYLHIDCFWVSGQFKGQGYGNQLLEECITDAKAKKKHGLTVLSSKKKLPFLSDPQYLKHKGFLVADNALPSFELLYLPFSNNVPIPQFKAQARQGSITEKGLVLYYSHQCPHTAKYVPLIAEMAKCHGVEMTIHKLETTEQAQAAPSPCTNYSLFYDGRFVTNEILSEKKFEKFLGEIGL